MDWSNERILEFIENYETEPILWNPQDPNYKKKHLNYDAWLRIKANLTWPVTVDDLKSKMKSLMAYYRTHLNKYKKSLKSGEDTVYQTNWFAFAAMNSFLAPVYEFNHSIYIPQTNEENETENRIDTEDSVSSVGKKPRRDNLPPEVIEPRPHIQEHFQTIKSSGEDEYEIFGKLIAHKIRKLKSHNTRDILMNDIYNLAFRAGMLDRLEESPQPGHSRNQSPDVIDDRAYQPSPNTSASHIIVNDTVEIKVDTENFKN